MFKRHFNIVISLNTKTFAKTDKIYYFRYVIIRNLLLTSRCRIIATTYHNMSSSLTRNTVLYNSTMHIISKKKYYKINK